LAPLLWDSTPHMAMAMVAFLVLSGLLLALKR
jgi:hypothetical protein